MNTLNIYPFLKKNTSKRRTLRTMFLGAFLLLAGAPAVSYAQGQAPIFVGGTRQTMSVCENSAAISIDAKLAATDANTGNTLVWSVFSFPSNGSITIGSDLDSVVAGPGIPASPIGFMYQPDPTFSGVDSFEVTVEDGTFLVTTRIVVTVNPLPLVQTFTGGGGYCLGSAGAPIGLTLSQTGVSYQLYHSAATVGGAVAGTGSAIAFGTTHSDPGYYYAIATGVGSCTATLPGVTVSVNQLPVVFNITGDGGLYCNTATGTPVGLDSSEAGISYQLFEGVNPVGSPVIGTGNPFGFPGLYTRGNYTVVATNTTTTCESNMAGTAVVDTLPSPTIFNVIGNGYYCLGGTGAAVTLDGSETDVNYQLIWLGFFPLGSEVAGTGDTLSLGNQILPGAYTAVATNTVTGCTNDMAGAANVNFGVPPIPYTVTQSRGGNYCIGDTGILIGLSNSTTGVDYQLYRNDTAVGMPMAGTGAPLSYGLFTTVGTYKIIGTNTTSGCISTMTGTSIVVANPYVMPTANISSGIATGSDVCYGSTATFTAHTTNGGTAPSYAWMVNNISVPGTDSTFTYVPVDGEILSVIVTSNALCAVPGTATDSITVNVDTLLAPSVFLDVTPFTSIVSGTPVTITAMPTHGGPDPVYQWFKNGVPVGTNSNVYTSSSFLNHDSVSCRMTSSGGCGGVVALNSVIITIFGTSVPNVTAALTDAKLVPNPNNGAFSITGTLATTNDAEVSLEVTNILGQVVYTGKVIAKNGLVNEQIQMGNATNGMYILNIRTATEQSVIRFVVGK